MAKKKPKDSQELLLRIRQRVKLMMEADRDNRRKALEDLKFLHVPGEQWDELVKRERGSDRPCYEFNKLRITVKRIVNDMRANRPQGKVRATEDGDKPTAEIYEGLIRNIWANADGDTCIDYAAEYQVGGGMGAWRVTVDYADDEAFEQTIGVEAIRNPFCLYADPAAQDFLKRDAADWFLTNHISKEAYEARWPKAVVISFDDIEFDDDQEWDDGEMVRVGEYWWKEPYDKTIYLLSNGITVNADEVVPDELAVMGLQILKERQVRCHKIMMCIASGDAILEGPTEWAGSMFPFVQVYGEFVVLNGETHWFGLTRFGKDAQRAYNYSRTNAIESVALAPLAKFWATPEQALGHTDQWAQAHKKNFPFQLYNADPKSPGPPQRMGGADVPVAIVQESQMSSEDIKAVTGIYDASLGAQGNETSGRAISARQRQGEIATFNYMDNLSKGIRRTWEIFVDLIPKIYDTQRTVRILGQDGAEKFAQINTSGPDGQALNDLGRGKYDVAVTVGPSFATMRQEAAEAYTELATRDPNIMMAAGDLVLKSMDLPYSDQIAERYRAILPPPVQQQLAQDKPIPPEVQAAMAQVQQAEQQISERAMALQEAEQQLMKLQSSAQGDAAKARIEQANIAAAEAQLDKRMGELEIARRELELARQQLEDMRTLVQKDVQIAKLEIDLHRQHAAQALTDQAHSNEMQAVHTAHEQAQQPAA